MNKLLIITGGSRGIGEKTIALFLENGWKIINISRTQCAFNTVIDFNIDLTSLIIGKRLIKPDEIARIIYFCATTSALNGATIDANLGERDI